MAEAAAGLEATSWMDAGPEVAGPADLTLIRHFGSVLNTERK